MDTDKRDLILRQITEHAVTIDDVMDVIIGLEFYYDMRIAVITRGDVEREFEETWEFHSGTERKMTEEEWQKFRSSWFWRKGHSEILWDGVSDAIRWDLADDNLLPSKADAL